MANQCTSLYDRESDVTPQEYVDEVLALVERIPPGRVMSYGAVAEYLAEGSGRESARLVGAIMSRYGGMVPWQRVVSASGRIVARDKVEALRLLRRERTPLRGDMVDMSRAAWWPDNPSVSGLSKL